MSEPTWDAGAHKWRQSGVASLLRCPRRFKLQYVDRMPIDSRQSGFARMLGTADHASLDLICGEANRGEVATREQITEAGLIAFEQAVLEVQKSGEFTDDDGLDRAVEQLEGVRADRLEKIASDPRTHAIEWVDRELRFEFVNRGEDEGGRIWRRQWTGTIDAIGVAKRTVFEFGELGREVVPLYEGQPIVMDWKTGESKDLLARVPMALSVQLGFYGMALARIGHPITQQPDNPPRFFIAHIQDVDSPKAPTDDEGRRIPKRLPKAINPAFADAAAGGDLEAAKASKRKPRDASGASIPKWLPEQDNPAFLAALAKPAGPVFREARIAWPVVHDTITAAIRQAEAGLFPASGALTGQCRWCPYSSRCASAVHPDPTDRNEDESEGY